MHTWISPTVGDILWNIPWAIPCWNGDAYKDAFPLGENLKKCCLNGSCMKNVS